MLIEYVVCSCMSHFCVKLYVLFEINFSLFLFEGFRLPAEHMSLSKILLLLLWLRSIWRKPPSLPWPPSSYPPPLLSLHQTSPFFPPPPLTAVQHSLASCWDECLSFIISSQHLHHHCFPLVSPSPPFFLFSSIPSKFVEETVFPQASPFIISKTPLLCLFLLHHQDTLRLVVVFSFFLSLFILLWTSLYLLCYSFFLFVLSCSLLKLWWMFVKTFLHHFSSFSSSSSSSNVCQTYK